MSPLGTLSLNPINSVPHSIFQLMNVTTNHLLNHHHLPSLTHSPNSRRNFKRMTLKDHSHTADKQQVSVCPPGSIEFRLSSSHSNKHLNSPPLPHSIINYISQKDCSPSPSPPPTNMQNLVEAEDDEVLSIGQEDDNDNQSDKDKSEPNIMSPTIEHKTDELDDIDVDDSNGSSYGSSPPLSISIQSPASSLDSSYIPNSNRKRNYSSSEDVPTSPIKPPPVSTTGTTTNSSYHPLNSLSEVLLNQTMSRFHQQQQQQAAQAQASLFFSIANILRPDFGKLSPPPPTGNFHHHRPIAKPLKRTSLKPDKISPIDLSRTHLPNGQIKSKNSHHHHHHHHKSSSHPHPQQKSPNSQHLPSPPPQKQARQQQPLSKSSKVIKEDKLLEEMKQKNPEWPAWVFCTRYSDRPSSGRSPRTRRGRKQKEKEIDEKRPRTAFTAEQLSRLKKEFEENRYLTEKRRQDLANDLRLHENQIKIWFQNKRAKLKKANGQRGGLALQLMAQGLYNHSTIPPRGCGDEDEDDDDGDESD